MTCFDDLGFDFYFYCGICAGGLFDHPDYKQSFLSYFENDGDFHPVAGGIFWDLDWGFVTCCDLSFDFYCDVAGVIRSLCRGNCSVQMTEMTSLAFH